MFRARKFNTMETDMKMIRRLEQIDMFDSPVPDIQGTNKFGDIEEIEDQVIERYKRFQSFKVVWYPPKDHKFGNKKFKPSKVRFDDDRNLGQPGLERAILREWKILQTGLPDSILVRGYRYRYDLMTAVIKGQQGTPYCSNLFFFDIHFPPDYPSCPPQLFSYSNGLDLSPHLRKDGKVCIPLLETPTKQPNREEGFNNYEEWNQESSNILQVLTSIQSLALDAKPYLHQPNTSVFERNKDAFLLGCVAIIQTLRKPPENFEDFVAGYYRKHTNAVLTIYRENYRERMENREEYVIELYSMLINAFEKNGVPCKHHKLNLPELKKTQHEAVTNHGLLGKISDNLNSFDDLIKFYANVQL